MIFFADFHVHSKYSMATAKNLDLEHLYIWAKIKGITVVGTGDFTHPVWAKELRGKLIEAENGLFRLKNEIERECDKLVSKSCLNNSVRFILTSEISNIYKKNGRVRKNHNLIFAPSFNSLFNLNNKLDKIGNITSDGRPILGLDAKYLLDIALNIDEENFFVPAHVWTPWFSLFGSKSGFDSIEECFEDLTPYIFALETGLSSDPAMNRRISALDKYTLISNSDAHSPSKLGREANLFDAPLSYYDMKEAMKTGDKEKFLGTFEFFPEEGKYHLDGHRKCGLSLYPEETRKYEGVCPKCGKSLTVGVLYRVEELSDMPKDRNLDNFQPFFKIIPLIDILSDILNIGTNSKKAESAYMKTIETLGDEFSILKKLKEEELQNSPIPLLKEAVLKIRKGDVKLTPGFDGEYGKIKIFTEEEKKILLGQKSIFTFIDKDNFDSKLKIPAKKKSDKKEAEYIIKDITSSKIIFNEEQKQAITYEGKSLLIIAGPGTGKTAAIAGRISFLIKEKNINSQNILAITFTNKAAEELKERIKKYIGNNRCYVSTFHSLCFDIIKRESDYNDFKIIDENDRYDAFKDAARRADIKENIADIFKAVISAKQNIVDYDDDRVKDFCPYETNNETFRKCYKEYRLILNSFKRYDLEDIIFNAVKLLENNRNIRKKYEKLFKYIFIDEYQDINYGQYKIIKALYGKDANLCAIGDPDQSIYGFRGSNLSFFYNFHKDFENADIISLKRNYRSTKTILKASNQVISKTKADIIKKEETFSDIDGEKSVKIIKAVTSDEEIRKIAAIIEKEIGGYGYFSIDSGKLDSGAAEKSRSFSDFAVLYRTKAFALNVSYIFEKAGVPYQIVARENIFLKTGVKELLSFFKIVEGFGTYIDIGRIRNLLDISMDKETLRRFKDFGIERNFSLNDAIESTDNSLFSENEFKGIYGFLKIIRKHKENMSLFSVSEKIDYIIKAVDIEKLIQDDEEKISAFKKVLEIGKESLNDSKFFFDKIAFFKDEDFYDKKAEKVSLMTMHTAKGLEFPIVFIAGCEDGFIPFNEDKIEDIEEEKRLFFVGMTRAKEELYLSFSEKRNIYGKTLKREPSRFIKSIDEKLLEYVTFYNKKKKYKQKSLL